MCKIVNIKWNENIIRMVQPETTYHEITKLRSAIFQLGLVGLGLLLQQMQPLEIFTISCAISREIAAVKPRPIAGLRGYAHSDVEIN